MSGHMRPGTVLLLVLIAMLLPAAPAMAVDFTVDVPADTHDATPGDDVCADANSACSLRAAIEESNALSASDDAIDLPSGDYLLTGTNGPLFIGSGGSLTINGASGAARDTVIRQETDTNGDGLDRVFDVGGASAATIRRVTIADGRATSSNGFFGGNIRSSGSLTLEQTTITRGQASSGGGISNVGGTLVVLDSTVIGNSDPDGGGDSGAIQNDGQAPLLQVQSSTISNNTGGIINTGDGSTVGTVNILDSTITGNSSPAVGNAGGLHMSSNGSASVTRTIVAGNTSVAPSQNCSADAGATITSGDHNLEGGTDCGFTEAGDLQNSDPVLAALADNGGETDTHAIDVDSPAFDAAADGCPGADQRGVSRPQGAACDIGSFELEQGAEGFATITSPGPLTSIYLGRSLECQVDLDGASQIFPGGGSLGSCTTTLLGVSLSQSSQSQVTGDGISSPFRVVTVMTNGSGITLRRTDTYVIGEPFWQSDVTVINDSGSPLDSVLWHGVDCLVAGSDQGYGFFANGTGAVYCAQNAAGGDIMLGLEPLSAGSSYYAGFYAGAFAPGSTGFGNTCSGDFQDNGVGLSWQISVADGGSETRTFGTTFQPAGTPCAVSDTSPPDTTISSAPAASTPSRDASFSFGSSDPSARFECSLDGGPFEACTSPRSYTNLPEGPHNFVVRAIDGAGNASSASHSWTIADAQRKASLADLPPPVVGELANVEVAQGTVLVAIPAGKASVGGAARASQKGLKFVPLQEARQIPIGSFLNTRKGMVRLQSATGAATTKTQTQQGSFAGGLFQVLQSRKKRAKGLTDLVLKGGNFNSCKPKRGKRAQAAISRRRLRRLSGNAKGRYRTRGKYAAATVRGTKWTVTDRCDGTLTKVARGKVAVRDFRRKRTILVKAGKSYLAKAKR